MRENNFEASFEQEPQTPPEKTYLEEFFKSFKDIEILAAGLDKIHEIEIAGEEGIKNQALKYDPENKKVIIYKDFLEIKNEAHRNNLLHHLVAEIAINEGYVKLEGAEQIIEKFALPPEMEASWINNLQKPSGMEEKDWQEYLKRQKIASRFAAYLQTLSALDMASHRTVQMDKETQKKLKKNRKLKENFLKENQELYDFFNKSLGEQLPESDEQANIPPPPSQKQEPIVVPPEAGKEEGAIEGILDDLSAIWQLLTGGKAEEKKEKPGKLRLTWLGKFLMRIIDYIETQKAYREKQLSICFDWGLQNSCHHINLLEDKGEPVDPVKKRVLVRFNSMAISEARGWMQYPLDIGIGPMIGIEDIMGAWHKITEGKKLGVIDIMKRIDEAKAKSPQQEAQEIKKIIQELEEIKVDETLREKLTNEKAPGAKVLGLYRYWRKTLEAADLRDFAGPMAALRMKMARFDEGAQAQEWLWTCNLLLWKIAPRPVGPEEKQVVPRLEYGLNGSHQYSNLENLILDMRKQLVQTRKWPRYLGHSNNIDIESMLEEERENMEMEEE